jgi:hypothetical protein
MCSALRTGDRDELRRFKQLLRIPGTVTFLLLLTSGEEETLAEQDDAGGHIKKSSVTYLRYESDVISVNHRQEKGDRLVDLVQIVQSNLEA